MKSKIAPITTQTPDVQPALDAVRKKLGRVPEMYNVMANSPAVLDAYVRFSGALSGGKLGSKMAEIIALATAEENRCAYCLSAHTFYGKKAGLSEEELMNVRKFHSEDLKINAALIFVKKMLREPKQLSGEDIEPLRSVGYSDGEILELIGNVVRNIFTNYLNVVAGTPVDWPVVVSPLTPGTV